MFKIESMKAEKPEVFSLSALNGRQKFHQQTTVLILIK